MQARSIVFERGQTHPQKKQKNQKIKKKIMETLIRGGGVVRIRTITLVSLLIS